MRWFKHDSDAHMDAKLKKLRIRHGMEAYGLYWYCLELIAKDVDETNLTFELEHDSEIIAYDTGMHIDQVQELMRFMVDLGLFESGENGVVTCLKMAKRLDKSMTSNPAMRQLITSMRTQTEDYSGYIYFVVAKSESLSKVKIGRSKNPWQRIKELSRRDDCQGFNLSLAGTVRSSDCVTFETQLHSHFKSQVIENEWFSVSDELSSFIKASAAIKGLSSYDELLRHAVVSPDKIRLDKKYKYSDEHYAFAEDMLEKIRNRIPKFKTPNLKAWAQDIRLLNEKDENPMSEIKEIFERANADDFWGVNIQSPGKLRTQYATLHAKFKKPATKAATIFDLDAVAR